MTQVGTYKSDIEKKLKNLLKNQTKKNAPTYNAGVNKVYHSHKRVSYIYFYATSIYNN